MKRCEVKFGDGERRTMRNSFRGMKYVVIERRRNMLLLTVRTYKNLGSNLLFCSLLLQVLELFVMCVNHITIGLLVLHEKHIETRVVTYQVIVQSDVNCKSVINFTADRSVLLSSVVFFRLQISVLTKY